MTRKQKLTALGAALALLTTSIGGFDYLQRQKLAVGVLMVVGSGIGWLVLLWRVRALRREHP